ncbi:MAG: hypothetical protein HZB42_10275 [Sphingobacteriales bacterium]|nr:hypothetical protein [Sphingobacteriales bacterium]
MKRGKLETLKPVEIAKTPQLGKIAIKNENGDSVVIFFNYDERKRLNKVEYQYSNNGRVVKENLFYDAQNRLYLIANEITNSRTNEARRCYFTIISYTIPESKVMSVSYFNTMNQRTGRRTFRYSGDSIIVTRSNESPRTTSEEWFVMAAGGQNVLLSKAGLQKSESVDFYQFRNPSSFLPDVYNEIYLGYRDFIWYVMEGNRNLVHKTNRFFDGNGGVSLADSYSKNIHGWVVTVKVRGENNGTSTGTKFRFEYLNE